MRPRLLPFELAWTDAAFDAIFPDGTALPHGIERLHPARYFDDLLIAVPLEQSIGLRLTLWIVALAPLFTVHKLGTIASIAPEDRARVLARLLASPIYAIRQLALSLKAMAALLYVQAPIVRAAMTAPRRAPVVALGLTRSEDRALRARPRAEGNRDHAAE